MRKLMQLPQSRSILELEKIIAVGQRDPGHWVAVMEGSNHGTIMPVGDWNALQAELKRRGMLEEMPPVREANDGPAPKILSAEGGNLGATPSK